jgi:poly [ADP-ribose] polymerase
MAADWKEVKHQCGSDALNQDFPDYEVIEHRIGNQTNADGNNNKFFSIELHKCSSNGKFRVYTNYGRVSDDEYTGSVGVYGPATESEMTKFFNSKFDSKVRPSKGYIEIQFVKAKVGSPKARQKVYKVSEDEVPEAKKKKLVENKDVNIIQLNLHPTISKLVDQLYRESSSTIKNNSAVNITSNGLETPLGVLTFKQIGDGKSILGNLTQAVKDNDVQEIRTLTGAFYSRIPANLGRKITDNDLINTDVIIQQKLDLLTMMEDALEVGGGTYTSSTDIKYKELNTEIEILDKNDPEYKRIVQKAVSSKGKNHSHMSVKVRNIYRVNLQADSSRYSACSIKNELELFHGSRNSNFLGIFKRGLLIAPKEAPRSGLAFGFGIYAASNSTKSLNYSLYPFPNMIHTDNCFLLVCNVKAGKQQEVYWGSGYEADKCREKGFDSVFAKEGKGLYNNEFIFPTVEQVSIKYLVELER